MNHINFLVNLKNSALTPEKIDCGIKLNLLQCWLLSRKHKKCGNMLNHLQGWFAFWKSQLWGYIAAVRVDSFTGKNFVVNENFFQKQRIGRANSKAYYNSVTLRLALKHPSVLELKLLFRLIYLPTGIFLFRILTTTYENRRWLSVVSIDISEAVLRKTSEKTTEKQLVKVN